MLQNPALNCNSNGAHDNGDSRWGEKAELVTSLSKLEPNSKSSAWAQIYTKRMTVEEK